MHYGRSIVVGNVTVAPCSKVGIIRLFILFSVSISVKWTLGIR
jgi:hypothetical protein